MARLSGSTLAATFAADGLLACNAHENSDKSFDTVFMDCKIPNMDGYAATEAIRAFEEKMAQKPTTTCALSAHVLQEHKDRAFASGMDLSLDKPVELSQLKQTLSKLSLSHRIGGVSASYPYPISLLTKQSAKYNWTSPT